MRERVKTRERVNQETKPEIKPGKRNDAVKEKRSPAAKERTSTRGCTGTKER
jgi:hypothetical protein